MGIGQADKANKPPTHSSRAPAKKAAKEEAGE